MKTRWLISIALFLTATARAETVIQPFEGDGFGDWKVEGEAFGDAPVTASDESVRHAGKAYASSFADPAKTGSLTSPPFEVTEDYLAFLIGGGSEAGRTSVQLLADDEVVREAVGRGDRRCRRALWDVAELRGTKVRLRILDDSADGAIIADHFLLTGTSNPKLPTPASTEGEGGLQATDALPGAVIPRGTEMRVVADNERHELVSPTALAFDEEGGLYVTETRRFRHGIEDNRDHLDWLTDDIASQTVEDRAEMLEKWSDKFEPGYLTEKSEAVRFLGDLSGDGGFGESKIFAEDLDGELDGTAAGVFAYGDTVYLASIPSIFALRDEDGDHVADKRTEIQGGFGVRFSLSGHDLNGFALGPDGMLYGTVGDRGFHITTREGRTHAYPGQGAVFRFDPDGTNFELVHTGLRNPKEIAFDVYGNAISVDNNSDQGDAARVVYIVEGADSGWRMGHQVLSTFHRQAGLEERPPNAWMDEGMWETEHDGQPAYIVPPVDHLTSGPSGLAYHPGTGFLEEEAGRFHICDYRGGAGNSGVWSFGVEPSGAGMKLVEPRRLVWGVGATDVTPHWDGRIFITDFVGGWVSHGRGRVLEVAAESPRNPVIAASTEEIIREGFADRPVPELAGLLKHADLRVRIRAQLELTRREDPGFEALYAAASEGEGFERLHGVWGLGVVARRGAAARPEPLGDDFVDLPSERVREAANRALLSLVDDGEAEVRAQVFRTLGNSGINGDRINFGAALQDASARVRMFAAIAAGRTDAKGSIPYVWRMLITNDNRDPYLRHAGAYALSLLSKPEQLFTLRLHEEPALRLAAVVALGRHEHPRITDFLYDDSPEVAGEALRLIFDRQIEDALPKVAALLDRETYPERSGMHWRRVLDAAYRLGGRENAKRVLSVAENAELPVAARREALRMLSEWGDPHDVDPVLGRHWPTGEREEVDVASLIDAETWYGFRPELLEDAVEVMTGLGVDDGGVPVERLRGMVMNAELPGEARAAVLERIISRNPDGLQRILVELAGADSDPLAIAAMRRLAGQGDEAAVSALRAARESPSARRRQAVWEIAADLEREGVAELFVEALEGLAAERGRAPDALELMAAAAERDEDAVASALAKVRDRLESAESGLASWNPVLFGGDPGRGERLFSGHPAAQCQRCHQNGGGHGGGGEAGPVLDGVAERLSREKLLESLVKPSAEIAAGFGVVSLTLEGGESVGGVLLERTEEKVVLDVAGTKRVIDRAEITDMTEPVSSMPPMDGLLEREEIRDLVAWLSTLEGEE